MTKLLNIYYKYVHDNHPLVDGISINKVPILRDNLALRFKVSPSTLDFSPDSLKSLEILLLKYSHDHPINDVSKIEIFRYIQELSAYYGYVLYSNTECQWIEKGGFGVTEIIYDSRVKLIKEGGKVKNTPVIIILGSVVSNALDLIASGKSPGLYKDFINLSHDTLKEIL
jgi:hypothetical protein